MAEKFTMAEKISVFFRSFFIQAGWNYLRYQNFGYLFAVHGYLRKIYPNDANFRKALLRNFEIFNTQPYFAGFVIGNVLGMESSPESAGKAENITSVKQSLACAYASIGDSLFWARLRIIAFTLTIFILVLLMDPLSLAGVTRLTFASLMISTMLYAGFSVYIRWKGLEQGYACAGRDFCGLNFMNWQRLMKFSSLAGFGLSAFLLVFFSFIFVYSAWSSGPVRMAGHILFITLAMLAQRFFRAKRKDLSWAVMALLIFSFVLNLMVKM